MDSFIAFLIAPFAEFSFMQRALAGCLAISLSAAPIGILVMLRRMSLIGDAMAHAILPGAATGYLIAGLSLTAMTLGGLLAGILIALFSGLLSRITIIKEDMALASFYLMSLALGVILISLRGSNVDLLHILFGSVLALDNDALIFLGLVSTITLITLALLARPLILECVDAAFLSCVSRLGSVIHSLFMILVVLNLVAGFQALGTLLAVGMMMLPAATAKFWSENFSKMLILAILSALTSSYIGLLLSYHLSIPAGPSIVMALSSLYLISIFVGPQSGLIWNIFKLKHKEH
jgi:zinc/manganese transport system permease protein